jgi:hypothetical protein
MYVALTGLDPGFGWLRNDAMMALASLPVGTPRLAVICGQMRPIAPLTES